MNRIHLLWLVNMIFLSGCQTFTPQQPAPDTGATLKPSVLHAQHMATLENIKSFSIRGRIAVITEQKNASARLIWQHLPEQDNIDVYSPLGSKVASIVKTPEQVTFTDNKQTLSATDTETLTQETLGFSLPLSGLSYWALGKPSNQSIANAMTWDNNGRIKTLLQDDWDIQYKDYATHNAYSLPKKFTLKNDRMTIKFIVDNWDGTP